MLSNIDDGFAKSEWLEAGYADSPIAPERLYDTFLDPSERVNLIDSVEHADVLADMRARLNRWMRETDDPLLAGQVPAPPEAELNDPDGLSHRDPYMQS